MNLIVDLTQQVRTKNVSLMPILPASLILHFGMCVYRLKHERDMPQKVVETPPGNTRLRSGDDLSQVSGLMKYHRCVISVDKDSVCQSRAGPGCSPELYLSSCPSPLKRFEGLHERILAFTRDICDTRVRCPTPYRRGTSSKHISRQDAKQQSKVLGSRETV